MLYHLRWPDLDLRSQCQRKQNFWLHFFPALFNWSGWNWMWCWNNSNWSFWYWFSIRYLRKQRGEVGGGEGLRLLFYWLRQKKKKKKKNVLRVGMHSDVYDSIWYKRGMMIDAIELNIFRLIYLTLILIKGHRCAINQKLLGQLSHKPIGSNFVQKVGMKYKMNNKNDNRNFNVGLHANTYRPISFKLGVIIETTKLYVLVSVCDLDLHSRSRLPYVHFLGNFAFSLDETLCWLDFCKICIQHCPVLRHLWTDLFQS